MPAYTKNTWVNEDGSGNGTIITKAKLDNIESGIDLATRQPDLTYEHKLAADVPLVVSPLHVRIDGGSFVADAATVQIEIDITAAMQDGMGAAARLGLFYADAALVAPPIIQPDGTGLRANTNFIEIGAIAAAEGSVRLQVEISGLTDGHTYNYEISARINGASYTMNLPDAPQTMACSSAVYPPSATQGKIGDRIIAISSATKLHILYQNHRSETTDRLLTGSGLPLTAGRTTGSVAVSPNGKRVAVTNYSLNTISLYDLSNPSLPTKIGNDIACLTAPYACAFSDNDTLWVTDIFVAAHFQKITGMSGSAPVAGASTAIDGTTSMTIYNLSVTPDGSKIVFAPSGGAKFYKITTATSAVSSVASPAGSTISVGVLGNSNAMARFGASATSLGNWDLNAMTISGTVTNANWTNDLSIFGLADLKSAVIFVGLANTTRNNIRLINLPASGGTANIVEYTSWSVVGTPTCGLVDDHGNILVGTSGGVLQQTYGAMFSVRPVTQPEKCHVHVAPAH